MMFRIDVVSVSMSFPDMNDGYVTGRLKGALLV